MVRGRGHGGVLAAVTRASTRQRVPPPLDLVAAEPDAWGGGRGRGRGRRRARGGGQGGALVAPTSAAPPPLEGHVGDQPQEFIIRLYKPLCGHLRLPTPFVREMDPKQPRALRLHMRGCGNGIMRVDVDFPTPHVMYLLRGWRTFAHAHSISEGHIL